jgi:predicted nucleic acid-binding protein
MIAVDINVLVRFLVRDDAMQATRAAALTRADEIWVSKTVLLETEWVLRSLYGFSPESQQVARTADFAVRVFSVATVATVPYSIVRQPTDRNSGVLFSPIDISLSPCACSGGERNSPSLISPCWRGPSTERGHCTLFT